MTYKLLPDDFVKKLDDGTVFKIPAVESYGFEYERWLAAGNTPEPMDTAPVVPSEVTMRQARLALLNAGKLASVDVMINSLTDPPKTAARIEWEYSNVVQRHNGFVSQIAPLLGMTEQDIDNLFIEAATL